MSRRVYLLGLGLALVALAFLLTDWLLPPPPPGVTARNVKRIRQGMTASQVFDILGSDATRLVTGDMRLVGRVPLVIKQVVPYVVTWETKQGTALVFFDGDHYAWGADWIPNPAAPKPDNLTSRLRAWLGL